MGVSQYVVHARKEILHYLPIVFLLAASLRAVALGILGGGSAFATVSEF